MKDLAERLSIGGISRLHSGPSGAPCVLFGLSAAQEKVALERKVYHFPEDSLFQMTSGKSVLRIICSGLLP
jgi:hypothetical protein